MFIDYARIKVESGNGGHGCVGFRREKFVAKGGPDGGDGGKGGAVIAVGDENINTLLYFKYNKIFKAKKGDNGQGNNMIGAGGDDVFIKVPLGTMIYDITDGKKELMVEITAHNQQEVIAIGGRGGRGNAHFVSSTNRAPRYAQDGRPGEHFDLELELKLMADIGLVGFPNAGKSTLLSVVSAARPKIADYEFTTLEPSLGVISFDDFRSCVMADIPGIIEGAHDGKGLGTQFLRHIQRTKILLFLIDINSTDPFQDYQILKKELHLYDTYLDKKPHLIVLSKLDMLDAETQKTRTAELKKIFKNHIKEDIMTISSVANKNIKKLKLKLEELITKENAEN